MSRGRTFAVALATAGLAVAPSAASAKTIIGSGSSVAEPYLRALFAGYNKVKPKVKFIYTADGGNAGVKDVQQKRRARSRSRPARRCPSDSGHHLLDSSSSTASASTSTRPTA